MYSRSVICVGVSLVLAAAAVARSHEPSVEREVAIDAPVASIAGTLTLPHAHDKVPCVVILGGTMSHDRDGAMRRPGAPVRDALRRLAQVLAEGGYASLRYDKVSHSTKTPSS